MNDKYKDEEAIYNAAAGKPLSERGAYLKAVCGDDGGLFARIEALLKALDIDDDFLKVPPLVGAIALNSSSLTEAPGSTIGRYKLLEKIGEGGMAVVYMAEQQEPIRRNVALKIIKLGMDTKQVITRFEAERQALALLDHPNIAKVLDAGATETGRPYFVMELVKGVSITEYCDKNNLNTKERLELFIQVCNAVQHAHTKGIIHRDIKPSNIMVTMHDGKAAVKVIDFGIAKATNQRLTEKTLFTRYAHIIGTPAYMSPEQAQMSDIDIDTRTDIYSLGVLLYELLTGTTPFSEEELRKAGYLEMQRVILEQEPVKPSTKLTSLGETLTDIAKHHGCTPDLLTKSVRGDLDWIVMKSLEKDRGRRYETAIGMADDIKRHLVHEPVLARGPSTTYHLQKFIHRHCFQILGILGMAVVIGLVIIIFSIWNHDRFLSLQAEELRDRNILSQAREQYARAEREAVIEIIKPILNSKHVGPEAMLLYAGILVENRNFDEAQSMLKNLVDDRPEIAGTAHSLLARILWENETPYADKAKEIQEHRQKAEALLQETPEAYFLRAMTAITVKDLLASLDKALQLDPYHYESRRLRAYTYYASRKYEKMYDDSLVMTVLRLGDSVGYSLRAIAQHELGQYKEAIINYDKAIDLTHRDDLQYILLSRQRCEVLLRMGDYEQVITDGQECMKLWPESPVFKYHIFCAMTALGEYDKAANLFSHTISSGNEAISQFRRWCARYVFDTLAKNRLWHPVGHEPEGAAFLPMLEAEETYKNLSAKGERLIADGFTANWSPDRTKLTFSAGVHGYSGVAIYDFATKQTELLIFPGKDPKWSPDGKYIAFVRDCQFLKVSEFTDAGRWNQSRLRADEEVWVIKSDGTEPRRLAPGGWPCWSKDSKTIYYQSRLDKMLCSITIEELNAEPKRIMACLSSSPMISPDAQHVAYLENTSLKVKDLVSQNVIDELTVPITAWSVADWSPTGRELCLASSINSDDRTGLWICNLDRDETKRILVGQVTFGSWSIDRMRFAFCMGPPYYEIWAANLDPNTPTIEALGPSKTLNEHFKEMVTFYTRRIEVDPNDAYAYSDRAHYYDYLQDKEKAAADMKQWSIMTSGDFSNLQLEKPGILKRVITLPSDCNIVFSAERPLNNIIDISVTFEQKGKSTIKLYEIPIFATSLFGLCLFPCIYETRHTNFTFGEPVNLGSIVNSQYEDVAPCISADGLSLFFSSDRPGGYGGADIWISTRKTTTDQWGEPINLGATVNTASSECKPCISADGLTLFFTDHSWYSDIHRPGGKGGSDLWMTMRASVASPWNEPVNLIKLNSTKNDEGPSISKDGLTLYFISSRNGALGRDVWMTTRATNTSMWGEPVRLGMNVNSSSGECNPSISPDGLILFFDSTRFSGSSGLDMLMSIRKTVNESFGPAVKLPIPGTYQGHTSVSPDGHMLYYSSLWNLHLGSGQEDIWQVPIFPIIDFNGDGKVDLQDFIILIFHWGTNSNTCDIGPMPWGDGVVDKEDLEVFMEYLK